MVGIPVGHSCFTTPYKRSLSFKINIKYELTILSPFYPILLQLIHLKLVFQLPLSSISQVLERVELTYLLMYNFIGFYPKEVHSSYFFIIQTNKVKISSIEWRAVVERTTTILYCCVYVVCCNE